MSGQRVLRLWFNSKITFNNLCINSQGFTMPISERKKEIKRRRHRKMKLAQFEARLKKGADKKAIADKIRQLTPGAEVVIENMGL